MTADTGLPGSHRWRWPWRSLMGAAAAVLTVGAVLAAPPAQAHKMKVFATAEAGVVTGHVYFSPGGPAIDVAVTATDVDGKPVFAGRSNAVGRFSFPVAGEGAVRVSADGGDGHVASFLVPVAGHAAAAPPLQAPSSEPAIPASVPSLPTPRPDATLESLIDARLAAHLVPLREQIDAYQEKIWWHDVLGGIGYIVGVAGFAFGWASRRTKASDKS